jgi:hypothetical protein
MCLKKSSLVFYYIFFSQLNAFHTYSVDSCDLKPDENPWIVFKSDSAMLRESITSYGRVESSNRASTSAFVKPGNPARSLPPHFEDYDDADHHVLYKTIKYLKLIFMKISDCTIFLIHENIMLHISQGKKDAHFML